MFGLHGGAEFLGLTGVDWFSYVVVWLFQIWMFWNGIEWIRRFLNFAGPFVYVVMLILMGIIWYKAGGGLLSEVGAIFSGTGEYEGGPIAAFLGITGTMIAYFAAVVINYGDFSRFVKTQKDMKLGNLIGLPLNVAFFSFIALFVTAGTVVLFGERLTNPADIVEKVDNVLLSVVAAVTFFAATVGINLVANFVPPAYDLANLFPKKINFRIGGMITAICRVLRRRAVGVVDQPDRHRGLRQHVGCNPGAGLRHHDHRLLLGEASEAGYPAAVLGLARRQVPLPERLEPEGPDRLRPGRRSSRSRRSGWNRSASFRDMPG